MTLSIALVRVWWLQPVLSSVKAHARGAALAPGLIAASVGGGFVLAGVVFNEWAVRIRERRQHLQESIQQLNLDAQIQLQALTHPVPPNPEEAVLNAAPMIRLTNHLAHVGSLARWPLRR